MMHPIKTIATIVFTFAMLLGTAASSVALVEGGGEKHEFTTDFRTEECSWSDTGENPFFILQPDYQLVLEGDNGLLVITVLDQTKNVGGVTTRVVEEREWEGDLLIEVSRNFFAICDPTNSVFYFGEEVDICDAGLVEAAPGVFTCEGDEPDHAGSWLAGENGAKPGIMMPGTVLLGGRYFQEIAPDVALDRAEIVSLDETVASVAAPGGIFERCLKTRETTPLEPNSKDDKIYAPLVGLVVDDPFVLTGYGFGIWP